MFLRNRGLSFKTIGFYGVMIFFSIVIVLSSMEALLYLTFDGELKEFRNKLVKEKNKAQQDFASLNKGEYVSAGQNYKYHPYYGYVNSNAKNSAAEYSQVIDSYGFRNDFDFKMKSGEVRQIGLFGGSAAFGTFLDDEHTITKKLNKILDDFYPGEYRVVNLAVPGWMYPQTAIAFFRELPFLDAAIFFDGVNELYLGSKFDTNLPIDFPLFDARHFFLAGLDPELFDDVVNLYSLKASFPIDSWISKARFFLFYRKLLVEGLEKKTQEAIEQIVKSNVHVVAEYQNKNHNDYADQIRRAISNYSQYSRTVDLIADGSGKKVLHVLQPVQYARMTADKLAIRFGVKSAAEIQSLPHAFWWYFDYGKLKQKFLDLWPGNQNEVNVKALDLSDQLPEDLSSSKYWFDPVHPRPAGTDLIAKKIFEKIQSANWFSKSKIFQLKDVTAVDDDNDGFAFVEFNTGLTPEIALNSKVKWLSNGKVIGQGERARVKLALGTHDISVQALTVGQEPKTGKLSVTIQDNLDSLYNWAYLGEASSNDLKTHPELANDDWEMGQTSEHVWETSEPSSKYYWQLDLGAKRKIKAVKVFFREGNSSGIFSNQKNVMIFGSNDKDFRELSLIGLNENAGSSLSRDWTVYTPDISYRYLRILRKDENFLSLAEVKVYGKKDPKFRIGRVVWSAVASKLKLVSPEKKEKSVAKFIDGKIVTDYDFPQNSYYYSGSLPDIEPGRYILNVEMTYKNRPKSKGLELMLGNWERGEAVIGSRFLDNPDPSKLKSSNYKFQLSGKMKAPEFRVTNLGGATIHLHSVSLFKLGD
jgi:hypothetical protein